MRGGEPKAKSKSTDESVMGMGMGIHGALLGLNVNSWAVAIAEFIYVLGGWCPHTWTGFRTAAFVDLIPLLTLSISSDFMLCQYIFTWEMNVSVGLMGAACFCCSISQSENVAFEWRTN
ncbi:unnamed protein product [Arabis nemorensis]|uniref:Uncharacterized protein n=1 Tax=Arabis nemorensis TaxID=586526 RepID=A0A565CKF8_9BRAS|nr:unnamed protein product [Arabis nemorensis]